ncbi:MAG TPA: DNA polymerase IV [Polyangiaceae bacterium]|nr:DNA polymerase IV [Polyangiaceae bacterium]
MPGERQILHIDMDAFYASVEQLDDPSLRGKPVLVGGHERRGVVMAASYEARPFGVHSAMPMAAALRHCPRAMVVMPRMARYAEVSHLVFEVLRTFTPLVEGLSLDEAFLDVTASQSLFGDGVTIARKIKEGIFARTGLRASAGVAPCKFVAKIASDIDKPDGLFVVRAPEVVDFLAALPIERMWGIGAKTAPKIHAAGLHTLGDLARADARRLEEVLGAWGLEAQALARGIDPRNVVPDRPAKSIGAEDTFDRDISGREGLERHLLGQASRVARRLCREQLLGRVVVVKVKYSDFSIQSRRTTVVEPVGDTDSIFATVRGLLDRFDLSRPIRLTGVSVADLRAETTTATLFGEPEGARRRRLEHVSLEIADRFGARGIRRAALVEKE